jgi:isopentenyldiphosphate isomerase
MEIWDILDAEGRKIGRTVQKGTKLRPNEYHLVVHIWVVDLNGNILIQKRAKHLEWMPGKWTITGGSAIHNEESIDAAMRKTSEELGLNLVTYKFMKVNRMKSNNQFTDVYFVAGAREDFLPIVLSGKVADAFWTSWRGMMEMVQRNEFVHYEYLELLKNIICNSGVFYSVI